MKGSIYQEAELKKLKKKAVALYKLGLPLREVGEKVGKSHEWVRLAVGQAKKGFDRT